MISPALLVKEMARFYGDALNLWPRTLIGPEGRFYIVRVRKCELWTALLHFCVDIMVAISKRHTS